MPDREALARLKAGVSDWNAWRRRSPGQHIDLSDAVLTDANLNRADLSHANLKRANFIAASLLEANLTAADLSGANFGFTILVGANLTNANLTGASFCGAQMRMVTLNGANLTRADLSMAFLLGADLVGADLNEARISQTSLGSIDLRPVLNLDNVIHDGPSFVDRSVLQLSAGKVSLKFLHRAGFQFWEMALSRLYDPKLPPADVNWFARKIVELRTIGPAFLGGVFISYSRGDAAFVDALEARLESTGYVVWRDVHDLVAGPTVRQISEAIREQDSVVVVLSKVSVRSDWVTHEVELARAREKQEGREFLCPIALDDSWKTLDQPVWTQVRREKNILDFSGWLDEPRFRDSFDKLFRGLKLYYRPPGPSSIDPTDGKH